jgi:hypothetical protein
MNMGGWEPFWIGPASRRMYGAFHGATGPATVGVVLVPPLLHEQPCSRRFLTEVAGELAALGLPCLRFDFHGTGDSGGVDADVDFDSMRQDLDLATDALRERAGVRRLALLAWRASALPLRAWLQQGGWADLVVLWEPVADGDHLLRTLVAADSGERRSRPRPRPGVVPLDDPDDGQLMGVPVSPRLRAELAQARLSASGEGARQPPCWAVVRADAPALPFEVARALQLPAAAPAFVATASMDSTFFLTPPVREFVGRLGQALRSEAWA